jgi:glycosyltransferase involved in cell wall biosynthesis
MKVAIATVQVPFITGGAELHAHSLKSALLARGIEADIVSIPFKWYPPATILDAMLMARLTDLSEVNGAKIDRVITLKFPAYFIEHRCKVAWLLHQHRQAYDLFETPFGDLHHDTAGRAVAAEIRRWDTKLLPGHRRLFANSRNVRDRLLRYNGLESEPLYHPPANAERYRSAEAEMFILAPGRLDSMKRQHLMIDAMATLPDNIRLVLIGSGDGAYATAAIEAAARLGAGRVRWLGQVSEEAKLDLYSRCLAVYNGVYDEDYGYITLESFLAAKPVIVHPDAGGPLEFVRDQENGFVVPASPDAIAERVRRLAEAPAMARRVGEAGRRTIDALSINWDHVIEKLLT